MQPQTTTCSHKQIHAATNNCIQPQTNTCSHKQLHTATNNYIQPQTTTCSHKQLHTATNNYIQPQTTAHCMKVAIWPSRHFRAACCRVCCKHLLHQARSPHTANAPPQPLRSASIQPPTDVCSPGPVFSSKLYLPRQATGPPTAQAPPRRPIVSWGALLGRRSYLAHHSRTYKVTGQNRA